MLYICFTADYELFFGKNFKSEDEVLIAPTYELMQTLERGGARLSILADVLCIMKYENEGLHDFAQAASEQLMEAARGGHDVQLHLHPHWITSTRTPSGWKFDMKRYRLHDFGFGEGGAGEIIRMSKAYLEDIIRKAKPDYSCMAFRAGGWCMQPEEELLRALLGEGIWIDTTIYRGARLKKPHYVDFTQVPDMANWWVAPELGIMYDAGFGSDKVFEVGIGSFWDMPTMWQRKLATMKIKSERGIGRRPARGMPADRENSPMGRALRRLDQFLFQPVMFNFEASCREEMRWIVERYLEKLDCTGEDHYIAMLGHPKNMTDENLNELEGFLEEMNRDFSGRVGFETLAGIGYRIEKKYGRINGAQGSGTLWGQKIQALQKLQTSI